jgi:hypothetical protein
MGGGGGRSLTLMDIRRNQQKVERRYGSFVLAGDDRAALPLRRGADDGAGPVPRPRGPPTGRDVPSRPATVPGIRQGATEQQQQQQARRDAGEREQPTELDLFRSCCDVETAAVDLEADIRRWTTMLWNRRTRSSGPTVDVVA